MRRNNRYYHDQIHKNITRYQFVRSVNPVVALRMRVVLEELKRREGNRE
ncbi:hypothetical protein PT300_11765 [Enterobacteriaceae bacterium ESL0689]|nr:hypothetical protein [Enterobacteriaceae bacterium ESL0689]